MANANQLKIEARREEAAGQYEEASRLYRDALAAMEESGDLSDPSLLVRVADLQYRQDDREGALDYYLRAVDEYADQGLITNAIAVCNKILRVFPDHVACHRRLADLHMDVGLSAEARQNLLRFVDEAWDPSAEPERVLEAMRSFLARTPDQEVAVRLASCLQELDREQEALDALEAVWEERSGEGADVEALRRKAEEIHDDAAGLSPEPAGGDRGGEDGGDRGGDEAGDDATATAGSVADEQDEQDDAEPAAGVAAERPAAAAAGGAETGRPGAPRVHGDGTAHENGREPWEDATSGASVEHHRPRIRGEDGPLGTGGELQLVASYRERFIEVRPPDPRRRRQEAGTDGTAGGEIGQGAGRGGPSRPSDSDPQAPEAAREREPAGTESDTTETPEEETDSTANGDATTGREEDIMDELSELDRMSDVAPSRSGDPGGREEREPPAPEEGADGGPAGAASGDAAGEDGDVPDRSADPDAESARGAAALGGTRAASDEELGEEAELRRGLELVDEMLEVQPDNLDLRERKLRYARRLGDPEAVVEASLDFADALAQEGARRSARALYRRVLERHPGNQAAESGLARLDVGELEEKRQAGKRAGAAHATPRAASPEEKEARRELGMRLWTEFENSIREMPWLHAATQAYQATGPEALPPLETFEMLAHYLMARERYDDAIEILERALDLAEGDDAEMADVLYHLGRAHEEAGRHERAAAYRERLESVDADYARIRRTLHGDDAVGSSDG